MQRRIARESETGSGRRRAVSVHVASPCDLLKSAWLDDSSASSHMESDSNGGHGGGEFGGVDSNGGRDALAEPRDRNDGRGSRRRRMSLTALHNIVRRIAHLDGETSDSTGRVSITSMSSSSSAVSPSARKVSEGTVSPFGDSDVDEDSSTPVESDQVCHTFFFCLAL